MNNLFLYFLIVNVVAFVVAGYDKYLAVNNKFRIPEKTLFTLAFCGGSIGLFLAMLVFRHKISKRSFLLKFFGIVTLHILAFFSGIFNT